MYVFETKVAWQRGKEYSLTSKDCPPISAATPPEFGGPEGRWSPESLLVAAVQSCSLSTLLYFVERFKIDLVASESVAKGTIEKTEKGERFTGIEVDMTVTVADSATAAKVEALRLQEKVEKYCLVSAALAVPVSVRLLVIASAS